MESPQKSSVAQVAGFLSLAMMPDKKISLDTGAGAGAGTEYFRPELQHHPFAREGVQDLPRIVPVHLRRRRELDFREVATAMR